ncbi:hypothetical protein ACP275_08G100300 [Erythranthe tilingii]
MDPPKKKISLKSYSDLPKKKKRSSYPLKSSPISFFFPLRRVQESITHATKSCPLQKDFCARRRWHWQKPFCFPVFVFLKQLGIHGVRGSEVYWFPIKLFPSNHIQE